MILLAVSALAASCEDGLTTNPDRYEAWRCFYMSARKAGSWAEAEARLTAGAATDPWAEISLGHVYSDQGDARAERHYRGAIAAFATRSERTGAAQARFGLANYLWHSGAGSAAPQAELELALADALAAGDARLIATARAQQARHLWRTAEDYGRAYSLAKAAEKDAFPDGSYQLRLLVLHVLSGVCDETGRVEEGLAFKARMVDLAAGAGDTYVEATARLNTAETWLTAPWLAAPGAALAEAERALDAARRANNPYSEAGARCVMARARANTAPPDVVTAVADWTACAEGYTAIGEQDAALYGRMGLAVASRAADPVAADAAVAAIVRDAEALGAQVRGLDARHVATELAWERGDASLALSRSAALLDAIEAAGDREVAEADRAGLGAHGAVAYDARASHLIDAGDLDGALATLERLRGRLLLEWLAGAEGPPSRREGKVASQGEAPRTTLDPALRELLTAPPPSVADLRGLLAADEAIVVYQLANPQTLFPYIVRSWAMVVTPTTAEVVPLDGLDGLDSRARLFEGLVLARDGSDAAAAAPLAAALIRPVEAVLPASVRRLVLVPDGAMHRLPLAALGGRLRAVSTVPSLRAWLALRRTPAPIGEGVLAVADPALPRAPAEVRAVVARLGGSAQIGVAGVDAERGGDTTLSLASLLGAGHHRVLHLAVHASVDEAHPERSVVRLGDDVELHPRDLAELPLAGQLVVLSACAGASGRVLDGEGVFGIARAFLQAGAHAVVASVWPIEDREAERVFTRFSDALGDGVTVDEALRIAQEDARAAGLPTGAWAGLVVVGDGGWAPFPGGVTRWSAGRWAAMIAGIGVAVAAVWRLFRRR